MCSFITLIIVQIVHNTTTFFILIVYSPYLFDIVIRLDKHKMIQTTHYLSRELQNFFFPGYGNGETGPHLPRELKNLFFPGYDIGESDITYHGSSRISSFRSNIPANRSSSTTEASRISSFRGTVTANQPFPTTGASRISSFRGMVLENQPSYITRSLA